MTSGKLHLLAMPDKFRGTATARQAADAILAAATATGWTCDVIPIADGGEGLLDCLGGPNQHTEVEGPLGRTVVAPWRLDHTTAVIEMSAASGMTLVGEHNRPLEATTRGTGQLIVAAIRAGAQNIIVGAGGSATTDGGSGAVEALQDYAPLDGSKGYQVTVAVDVDTTFVDAARTFGPQKGADTTQVRALEVRLQRLHSTYQHRFGIDVTSLVGGGAAGGLAGGLAVLGARLQRGFALVANHLDLATRLDGADLVITGEGKLDRSSLMGKAPVALAELLHSHAVPLAYIVGTREPGLPITDQVIALDERFGPSDALTDTIRCITLAAAELLARHPATKRK